MTTDLTYEDLAYFSGAKIDFHEKLRMLGGYGTPVNAVNATMTLGVSGVAVDSETVSIGTQKYEFCADTALTKTLPTNIAIDISDHAAHATDNLTIAVQPTAGDTMTIGAKIYVFVPNGTDNLDTEISVATSLASAKLAIVAAINGTDGHNTPHPLVSAATFAGDVSAITALVGGTVGNSIATTENFTSGSNVFSLTALAGGTNCSAANAQSHLVTVINANDTQGVTASNGSGTDVLLTADVAGVAANNIALAETMTNGAFTGAAVKMAGGINGTIGIHGQPMVDATYLYIASADNTVVDKNWRRVSLGSAF
jgi:hypothetical protein